jgi:predicted nucleic acid-binding protein
LKTTFIDSGVLIAAIRGAPQVAIRARKLLTDPERSFASSAYVRLEVLPKAKFQKRFEELDFHEWFFRKVQHWAPLGEPLVEKALEVALGAGLSALDALHVAAALMVGADELITAEKRSKPIHRVQGITIRTILEPWI